MSTDSLRVTYSEKILRIELNRVRKKNAITQEMYRGMIAALEQADADEQVHCIFLTGAPDCFCAGNDLKDFLTAGAEIAADFVNCISAVKKPIVAAVNGPAVGVGATMLLHCDLVVAAQEAYFSMPFTDLGLCAEAGVSYLLPRMVGQRKAAELLLLGSRIDADKALDFGMVNQVCHADSYQEVALCLAAALAAKPQKALLVNKALMKQAYAQELSHQMREELEQFKSLLDSAATQKIIAGLLDR